MNDTAQPLTETLEALGSEALAAIAAAPDLDALDEVRQTFMGKKGRVSLIKRQLGGLDHEDRRVVGQAVNDVNARFAAAFDARRTQLELERDAEILAAESIDITLPPRVPRTGSLHPLRQTLDAILDVFVGLGYEVVTGPEVESDWFNFDALNTPMDHPARTLQDTIYVQGLDEAPRRDDGTTGLLLRTQTSPMQIRTMLDREPPVYVAVPGRVYRQDTPDATHLPVFHQIEGLALDTDLSLADLYGTLMAFARALVGEDVQLRFRPHYFPFTEPSAELDAWVPDGRGGGRWTELLGSGMVHPNVLAAGGHDPEVVQGFAFGIGIERTAMVRYGVPDLRLFADNDIRLLSSF
ncbi:phenylalanine--tRNA ligase subunit alpha [Euzebya sp.]|uniref:phenylalanine--tRNA ligase subunit alpha n=1 Tax=Euzebya sp. TaxID=1971409 RepID=UPI0035139633